MPNTTVTLAHRCRNSLSSAGLLPNKVRRRPAVQTLVLQEAVLCRPLLKNLPKTGAVSPGERLINLIPSPVVLWAVRLDRRPLLGGRP